MILRTVNRLISSWRRALPLTLVLCACGGSTGDDSVDRLDSLEAAWDSDAWQQGMQRSARDLDTLLQVVRELAEAPDALRDPRHLQRIHEDLQRIEDSIPKAPFALATPLTRLYRSDGPRGRKGLRTGSSTETGVHGASAGSYPSRRSS
jgi:hypothetical protein